MKIFNTREDLIKSLPLNMNVAEIGVFKGEFSKFIFKNLNPKNLILIDLFEGIMGSGNKDGQNMEYVNLQECFNELNCFFSKNKNVKIIKGKSTEQLIKLDNSYLDMIYIDSSHDYEETKKELFLSFEKVKKGGYICGHDYEPKRYPGVVKAVNEFCNFYKLEITCLTKDKLPTFLILNK